MMTFDQAVDKMIEMKGVCSRVSGFSLPTTIKANYNSAVKLYEGGRVNEGVAGIVSAVEGVKQILAAFFRNSVSETGPKASRFVREIRDRIDRSFEPEIINRLEQLLVETRKAIESEKNGSFEKRIAAFNRMQTALTDADNEQGQIDANQAEERRAQEEAARLQTQEKRRQQAERARAVFA